MVEVYRGDLAGSYTVENADVTDPVTGVTEFRDLAWYESKGYTTDSSVQGTKLDADGVSLSAAAIAAAAASRSLSSKFKLNQLDLEGVFGEYFDAQAAQTSTPEGPTTFEQMQGLYPWLDDRLITLYLDKYTESGSERLAIAEMRADPMMEVVYPGIRDKDGTLKMTEQEYVFSVDSMKASLRKFNLNPNEFLDDITSAIAGKVAPLEFDERLEMGYEAIVNNIPEIKEAYLTNFGIELPNESIFAMFVSPTVSRNILEGNIRASQILGEAESAGIYGITSSAASNLVSQGLNQESARKGFSSAAQSLTGIQAAARSQGRENITAQDYVEATQLGSAEDIDALNRVIAQQRSVSTAATGGKKSQTGEVTGLIEG
tara:strand:+ start:879 stop:2000 length:1122 start_codon:yes stop_codon:yes gene_type:complete